MNDLSEAYDEDLEWFRKQKPEIMLLHPVHREWLEDEFTDWVAFYVASGKYNEYQSRLKALERYERDRKRSEGGLL